MRRKKDGSNGITALYERLSRDDDNAGESNSIVHQKQMLEDYAIKHGFTNLVHFTDDGWSGATFDRPSWNRLVEGVKNGEITACICKDMSRIGRDHLQVGFFTDILFREKEVRFIAINNGIDSDRQETSEFAPFLNIMNEWFVRDTSKKIKAVLKSRGSSGNAHTSNIPPYGYLKDPENPDHWIIDEEAAEVVRRIYRMTIEGKGPYQIARELSEEKIIAIRKEHKDYGYRRIHAVLRKQGFNVNKKRVQRIIQKLGLQVTSFTRKSRKYSSYKGNVGKVAPNRIHRRFNTSIPHQKITTDTTEFKYFEIDSKGRMVIKKLYLDPFLDMFNGEVLSYSISKSPSSNNILTA